LELAILVRITNHGGYMAITAKQEGIFVCAYDGDRKLWQEDGNLVM